jgi:hypothetical protein
MESIGSAAQNIARVQADSPDAFYQLRQEAAASKLYYLRDSIDATEFEAVVEEEVKRSTSYSLEKESKAITVAKSVGKKLSKAIKLIFCPDFPTSIYQPYRQVTPHTDLRFPNLLTYGVQMPIVRH